VNVRILEEGWYFDPLINGWVYRIKALAGPVSTGTAFYQSAAVTYDAPDGARKACEAQVKREIAHALLNHLLKDPA
jgi:hypothetical protein